MQKKFPLWRYPRHIAHRCGGALAPENTLAGLRLAARLGFRAVEFDVMLSKDGTPLLIHDETLERTTSGKGCVAQSSWKKLSALDAGRRHHRAFVGEPLPSFEQALRLCQELGLAANVEIKPALGHDVATGGAVACCIADCFAAMPQRAPVLLSSFSESALAAARGAVPGLMRALLVEDIPGDWLGRLQALDCQALHCSAVHLEEAQIAEVNAAGVPLACYTVNQPEAAKRLFDRGVAAIFTDRLDLFDPAA